MQKKTILIILDGWGITPEGGRNVSAIAQANTPFINKVWREQPHSQLQAHGIAVGLPEDQMGNSEVGHITLGAGRVVYQSLVKINMGIEDRSLSKNKVLLDALAYAKKEGKKVHFMGLVSDGGIHAHIFHLKALCSIAREQEVKELYIHAFTDGRDADPKSGIGFLEDLEAHLQQTTGRLASIIGRYYAMDRGKNWHRTAMAYQALVNGKADTCVAVEDWKAAMQQRYDSGETDEFVKPIVLMQEQELVATIGEGDVVVCFNFRTDRARQLTEALTQRDFPDHDMHKLDLRYLTMTRYDETFENVGVLFENPNLQNTLGEVLSKAGKKQIRIAETTKYPHVTYFFNGGQEKEFEGEERIMVDSPDVPTFDQKPEMSAVGIRYAILSKLREQGTDFICLNFANADMVGHTGDMQAAIKACETVDSCLQTVAETALEAGYAIIILADHGNAEKMKSSDGSPFTAHTTSPVPCILLGAEEGTKLKDGKLGDVAPTILTLMGIPKPEEMSGSVLIEKGEAIQ
ncbi:phosphoglyceromutase [Pontibacter korlensis]|uniref:2,3-bisphosphoglycerate-independent phosphoglycerate mutase n=1 Tax=Pontibacter korlensis TaxID=400092 RepID=A0A0E3UZD4_9BACT|nr:2,3-bisphosphoglycerate-independent phosphoglycerate mutase [Pontibacter korlensis]AKD05927.1 phosphoglyceromutase [Pontibacter korlensis]